MRAIIVIVMLGLLSGRCATMTPFVIEARDNTGAVVESTADPFIGRVVFVNNSSVVHTAIIYVDGQKIGEIIPGEMVNFFPVELRSLGDHTVTFYIYMKRGHRPVDKLSWSFYVDSRWSSTWQYTGYWWEARLDY